MKINEIKNFNYIPIGFLYEKLRFNYRNYRYNNKCMKGFYHEFSTS